MSVEKLCSGSSDESNVLLLEGDGGNFDRAESIVTLPSVTAALTKCTNREQQQQQNQQTEAAAARGNKGGNGNGSGEKTVFLLTIRILSPYPIENVQIYSEWGGVFIHTDTVPNSGDFTIESLPLANNGLLFDGVSPSRPTKALLAPHQMLPAGNYIVRVLIAVDPALNNAAMYSVSGSVVGRVCNDDIQVGYVATRGSENPMPAIASGRRQPKEPTKSIVVYQEHRDTERKAREKAKRALKAKARALEAFTPDEILPNPVDRKPLPTPGPLQRHCRQRKQEQLQPQPQFRHRQQQQQQQKSLVMHPTHHKQKRTETAARTAKAIIPRRIHTRNTSAILSGSNRVVRQQRRSWT